MDLIDELAKLVYDYSSKSQFADEKFIMNAMDLCIHNFDVADYVKKCEINNYSNQIIPTGYSVENKTIVFNRQNIIDKWLKEIKTYGFPNSQFMTYIKVNLGIIHCIVHELTHAKQYKKCLEYEKSIERELLELSMIKNLYSLRKQPMSIEEKNYFRSLDEEYKNPFYYIIVPYERMAEIIGYEYENNISKLFPEQKKENIEEYTEFSLLVRKAYTYKDFAPTTLAKYVDEHFRSVYGLSHGEVDLNKIEEMYKEKSKELTLDEKLYLGLPVEASELQKIKEKEQELRILLYK